MTNIFETASRAKLRFESTIGLLSVEHLWDLPLTSKQAGQNLNDLAKGVHAALKDRDEVSFVDVTVDREKTELELKLDILKRIIAVKIEERDMAKKASANAARRERIYAALERKQDEALEEMSEEELKAELKNL